MWSRRALLKAGGVTLFTAGISGSGPSFLSSNCARGLRAGVAAAPQGFGDDISTGCDGRSHGGDAVG